MKKHLFLWGVLATTLLVGCGNKDENRYSISGTVPAAVDAEWMYMYGVDGFETHRDSARIVDGQFRFEGTADSVEMVVLHPGTLNQYPALSWNILLEAGDIVVDTVSQYASGTQLNDGFKSWMEEIMALPQNDVEAGLKSFFDKHWSEHSGDVVGSLVLSMLSDLMEFNYVDSLLSQVPATVKNNKLLESFMTQWEANRAMQPGHIFTDLELRTLDGEPARLSDYVGKGEYVLVDMWASWCGPCRQAMPQLQATVAKYSKKLKVVGVAESDKPDDTRRAIDALNIKWTVLSDEAALAAQTYGFNAIPFMILFAPDGTIAARGVKVGELDGLLEKML